MALTVDEVKEIASHPQWVSVAESLPLTKKSLISDLDSMRQQCGEFARAVIEVAVARKSAATKLPGTWIMSSEAAQQATPYLVAVARARRLRDTGLSSFADVTCSIGTEVAALSDVGLPAIGSDIDAARIEMARHNVPGSRFLLADALAPAYDADVIIADPARRAGGRRIARPEDLLPPLPDLISAWSGRQLAIKCAPGLDFSEWEGEVALASVDGAVKEACLYTPGLALQARGRQVTRSALVIETVGKRDPLDLDATTVTRYDDTMDDDCDVRAAGRYIVDPDGAVVRAGLVRHFAAAHGLWQLDERIAHLSGDRLPEGVSGFEVIEQVGLKQVRKSLAALDCGAAEILVRGVDVNPDVVRKQWKLRGSKALAVVITRIGKTATAFICHPRAKG
nr:SAM-dependent methyltransferase [Corynebacterium lactis]